MLLTSEGGRILVVEDDEAGSNACVMLLQHYEFDVGVMIKSRRRDGPMGNHDF